MRNEIDSFSIHSPGEIRNRLQEPLVHLPKEGVGLEDVERQLLQQALEQANGNKTKAAKLLRISRDTLRYKVKKHGLE